MTGSFASQHLLPDEPHHRDRVAIDAQCSPGDSDSVVERLQLGRALEKDVRTQAWFAAGLEHGRELLAEFEVEIGRELTQVLAELKGALRVGLAVCVEGELEREPRVRELHEAVPLEVAHCLGAVEQAEHGRLGQVRDRGEVVDRLTDGE